LVFSLFFEKENVMAKKKGLWLIGTGLLFMGLICGIFFFIMGKTSEPVMAPVGNKPEVAGEEIASEEIVDRPEEVTLLAVGDIMLARKVERLMSQYGLGYPLSEVKSRLSQADITFGNLECAVSDKGTQLPGKGIWLRAKPEVVSELKDSGFDVLSVANNHSLDYDTEAFLDTLYWIEQSGIKTIGGGNNIDTACSPFISTVNGVRVGFLAYTEMADMIWSYDYPRKLKATDTEPGVAPFKYDSIVEDIRALDNQVDVLVLSLHWGTEYSLSPTPLQREQARGFIDAGADLIIGHHPHVIQGVELYKNGVIAYSLGNFVFDQNQSDRTREGLVMEVTAEETGISEMTLYPVIIIESQPRFEQNDWAKKLAKDVQKFSLDLGTGSSITENPLQICFVKKDNNRGINQVR